MNMFLAILSVTIGAILGIIDGRPEIDQKQ